MTSFANSLKFTMASRKATLAADALQVYSIAKGIARDPGAAAVASLVSNLNAISAAAAVRKAPSQQRRSRHRLPRPRLSRPLGRRSRRKRRAATEPRPGSDT